MNDQKWLNQWIKKSIFYFKTNRLSVVKGYSTYLTKAKCMTSMVLRSIP